MTQQCCCGIHFWNWGRALKQCAPLIGQLQYFALLVGSSFSCKLRNKWDIVLCIRWAIGSLSLGTKHLMGVLMVVKQSNSDIIVAHKRWYFVHIFLRALSHWVTCWQRWCWLWNLDRDSKTQTTTSAWHGHSDCVEQIICSPIFGRSVFLIDLFHGSSKWQSSVLLFMMLFRRENLACYRYWHALFPREQVFWHWAGMHIL